MITSRPYRDDYHKIMDFLREMYLQTKTQHCWLPQRWEYAESFVNPLCIENGWDDWHPYIKIWEEDSVIVGICHKEGGTDAFLQLRPGYKFLTDEMLDYAQSTIAAVNKEGKRELTVWSIDSNVYLNGCLTARGYTRGDDGCYYNAQYLDKEYTPELLTGYSFTCASEVEDALDRQNAVSEGFDHGPCEEVSISFLNMEKAPLFRPELEIMTRHKVGALTSFCVVWYDPQTNTGMFEPVATHPDHRKLGLGRAMLIEGLRRLKAIGTERAFVESYGDNRKAFYNSAGFETFDKDWYWTKEL